MQTFFPTDVFPVSSDKSGANQDKIFKSKISQNWISSSSFKTSDCQGGRPGRGGLREIKFDAGAIRPVPVGAADNQNGGKLMQSADLYRV